MNRNAQAVAELRHAASILEGLPGLPEVAVSFGAGGLTIQIVDGEDVTEHQRSIAVDMIAAVIGAEPVESFMVGHVHYYGTRRALGGPHVFAANCRIITEAGVTA